MKNRTPPHDNSSVSSDNKDIVELVRPESSKNLQSSEQSKERRLSLNSGDSTEHKSVLLEDVMNLLAPQKGESYLDLTAGYGGHTLSVISETKAPSKATLVDRDVFAFEYLEKVPELKGANLVHNSFKNACDSLIKANTTYDMILLDLGVSSPQLDNADRGFSFKQEAKLDMRMDQGQELTAEQVINTYSRSALENILKTYGEVKNVRKVVDIIIDKRPYVATTDFAESLKSVNLRKPSQLLSQVFQAIRIEVNQELVELQEALVLLPQLLNRGGRLAVISFHSLEDRAVKNTFKLWTSDGLLNEFEVLTKSAIQGKIHDVTNPRSRSAMLRAVAKIK